MNFYTYPQQYYQPQQTVMRVVTSRAEAEVAQIPLDGSNAFFFNTSFLKSVIRSSPIWRPPSIGNNSTFLSFSQEKKYLKLNKIQ